jgi:hypothetical protein
VFVTYKPFEPSIIFAVKDRAYLSAALFRCSRAGYWTRLIRLVGERCYSLFAEGLSDEEKTV